MQGLVLDLGLGVRVIRVGIRVRFRGTVIVIRVTVRV